VQDGPKMRWLCDECEQRFSDAERPFAAQLFAPVHSDAFDGAPILYESWAHYLAVSVSWRSLLWCVETTPNSHLKPPDLKRVDWALTTWRAYLLGQRADVGCFVQHAIPCGTLAYAPGAHPFISRYFERTSQIDLISAPESCVVYSKMARVIIFGVLRMDKQSDWKGSRLHPSRGHFGGAETCRLPPWMPSYWNGQAAAFAAALDSVSPRQKQKIVELMSSADPDVLANSTAFQAFKADYELSGDVVFSDHRAGERDC
jgi:hypothetical protein